jgi:hypothetical protein
MSFLKSKHNGWLSDGTRTPFSGGGSGGGGGPTQTTAYNTNIPEYARPYVENMLQSAQSQVYNDDMTSFRGYTPYSSDVNNYFAGFSPLQQSAQESAYYMQTPGQFGMASNLAGMAGMGGLGAQDQSGFLGSEALGYGQAGSMYGGLGAQQAINAAQQTGMQAGMYGGLGAGFGGRGAEAAEQGFGAGAQFAQQATDPNAVQSYMSPYMQNVVDFQKQSALRDFQVAQPMRQAQAVAKGAFGGSRQAIENAEAQRNLNTQLQGIQATGTQKAFEDAQRQQQFGAQLGLQGLQAGYGGLGLGIQGAQTGLQGVGAQQAAGQLGLAGTAQGMQGAQTGLQGVGQAVGAGQYGLAGLGAATQAAGTLGQLGTQQFGAEKDIINLQSTMGAQQQALEQSKINQAIQDYAIQQQYPMMQLGFLSNMLRGLPMQSQTTQLYQAQPSSLQQGIGLLGAGSTLFGGKAEGGAIKMAEGGITGYKYGGAIPEPKLESMADSLSVQQLQQRIKDPALTPGERQVFQEALAAKQQVAARSSGIAAAGGGLFNTMGYAGGGILAFAGDDDSLVNSDIDPETGEPYKVVDPIGRFSEYMNPFSGKGSFGSIARKGQSIEDYYKQVSKASPATEADRRAQAQMEVQDMEGSSAKDPTIRTAPAPRTPGTAPTGPSTGPTTVKGLEAYMAEQERLMGPNTVGQGLEAKIAERLAGMDKRASQDERAAMRQAFVKFGTEASPGGIGVAALKGISTYGDASDAAKKVREGMDLELTKMQADIKKGERAEKRGNLDAASKSYENAENRQLKIAEMQNQLKVAGMQASRASEFERQYEAFKADPKQFEQFKKSLTSQDDTARLNAYVKADEFVSKAYPSLMFSKKPEDKAKLDEIRNSKVAEYLGALNKQQTASSGGARGQVDTKNPLLGS